MYKINPISPSGRWGMVVGSPSLTHQACWWNDCVLKRRIALSLWHGLITYSILIMMHSYMSSLPGWYRVMYCNPKSLKGIARLCLFQVLFVYICIHIIYMYMHISIYPGTKKQTVSPSFFPQPMLIHQTSQESAFGRENRVTWLLRCDQGVGHWGFRGNRGTDQFTLIDGFISGVMPELGCPRKLVNG